MGATRDFSIPVVQVTDLCTYFYGDEGIARAVDGVSFTINKGETLGLVGESGSGKTTVGRCVVKLYEPTEGRINFNIDGQMIDVTSVPKKDMKSIRKHFQMLFQDEHVYLFSKFAFLFGGLLTLL